MSCLGSKLSICSFLHCRFLTIFLFCHSWRRGFRLRLLHFENVCSVEIDWGSMEDIFQLGDYVEHWRLILWDKAFLVYFDDNKDLRFVKGLDFMEFKESPISIKRIAYW